MLHGVSFEAIADFLVADLVDEDVNEVLELVLRHQAFSFTALASADLRLRVYLLFEAAKSKHGNKAFV